MAIKGAIGMSKNMFEIRDELSGELVKIQQSKVETSRGWEVLKYLQEVDYSIRLIVNSMGGKKMQDRSCLHCKWRTEKSTFLGLIHWCGAQSNETTLNGYCLNFKEKKK